VSRSSDTAQGPADRLPVILQHLALMVTPSALAWGGHELVPFLQHQGPLAAGVGVGLTALIAVLTPITRQYGIGRA
jgi:hypothetical protein